MPEEISLSRFANAFGPDRPDATCVPHAFPEQTFDAGEVPLNYAVAGSPDEPALLLSRGQTESWWGYEQAMPMRAEYFRPSPSICVARVDRRARRAATRSTTWATISSASSTA